MKEEALCSLGLTDKEIQVYLASLQLGSASVTGIASHARLNRTSTYDILAELERQGLVSHMLSAGRRKYQALEPRKLVALLRERENLVRKALPELTRLSESIVEKPRVEVYVGYQGIRALFEDILKNGRMLYSIASKRELVKLFRYAFPHFVEERKRRGIRAKLIIDDKPLAEDVEYRIIRGKLRTAMWCYNNRVVIISLEKREPVGILIHEKHFYSTQKLLFNQLWDALPEPSSR